MMCVHACVYQPANMLCAEVGEERISVKQCLKYEPDVDDVAVVQSHSGS